MALPEDARRCGDRGPAPPGRPALARRAGRAPPTRPASLLPDPPALLAMATALVDADRRHAGLVTAYENALIVQSDLTVLLEVASPKAGDARAALARFAELEKSPEHVHTYRISPLSLWNAAAAGVTADEVCAALDGLREVPRPAVGAHRGARPAAAVRPAQARARLRHRRPGPDLGGAGAAGRGGARQGRRRAAGRPPGRQPLGGAAGRPRGAQAGAAAAGLAALGRGGLRRGRGAGRPAGVHAAHLPVRRGRGLVGRRVRRRRQRGAGAAVRRGQDRHRPGRDGAGGVAHAGDRDLDPGRAPVDRRGRPTRPAWTPTWSASTAASARTSGP